MLWTLGIGAVLILAGYIAFKFTPWFSAIPARERFDKYAMHLSLALEKHVPPGVSGTLNEPYDSADRDAYLDVFYPSEIEKTRKQLPTIVWVHGGGWISGSKNLVANYGRILAGKGYTVAVVDYSLAPGKTYPRPPRQVNAALSYLVKHAERLHVDPSRFVLAGNSAGAQIAAQLATAISVPAYAKTVGLIPAIGRPQLIGVILYCGIYDVKLVALDGLGGDLMRTTLWSYSGTKTFKDDSAFAGFSVINYVTGDFPPMFISSGNGDPLTPQSLAFAVAVSGHNVYVDSLFFPSDYRPVSPHDYQFSLDTAEGKVALERSVKFLSGR